MLASSVLQPRKSEVKHGVRHRKQPRKQEARRQRANRNTTPNTSATASIARERRTPLRAPQPPVCARAPSVRRAPPARARPPSVPDPPARQNPQRARTPQRAPGRKPGSGASTEPTIGLRDVNRAEQRVPRAVAEPSSEFPLRRIVNFVQLRSKLTILRSLKAKTHDYLRYRETHTRTTGKNVRFSLPRPRKTGCFDHQRPKQTVFRIAHPTRQPIPMSNKQHSRHRSR